MAGLVDARALELGTEIAARRADGQHFKRHARPEPREPFDTRQRPRRDLHPLRARRIELGCGEGDRLAGEQVELPRVRLDGEDLPLRVPRDGDEGIVVDAVPLQRFGGGVVEGGKRERADGRFAEGNQEPVHVALKPDEQPDDRPKNGRQQDVFFGARRRRLFIAAIAIAGCEIGCGHDRSIVCAFRPKQKRSRKKAAGKKRRAKDGEKKTAGKRRRAKGGGQRAISAESAPLRGKKRFGRQKSLTKHAKNGKLYHAGFASGPLARARSRGRPPIRPAAAGTQTNLQRCLSGLRSTTGNRVYLVRVPRVQIPLSAPCVNNTNSFAEFVLFFARDFFGAVIRLK